MFSTRQYYDLGALTAASKYQYQTAKDAKRSSKNTYATRN
jgi:hypothetical protein